MHHCKIYIIDISHELGIIVATMFSLLEVVLVDASKYESKVLAFDILLSTKKITMK
ncbi:unnamed protein product [Schistosoma curassoni]|uniref:Uncharacterized protein n=1 Tax=Schistosoma curassoni TaxID=6186 RepID=A0A183KSS8_9TREM|nr:unnamed protein product [Schistosoma curassoni]